MLFKNKLCIWWEDKENLKMFFQFLKTLHLKHSKGNIYSCTPVETYLVLFLFTCCSTHRYHRPGPELFGGVAWNPQEKDKAIIFLLKSSESKYLIFEIHKQ